MRDKGISKVVEAIEMYRNTTYWDVDNYRNSGEMIDYHSKLIKQLKHFSKYVEDESICKSLATISDEVHGTYGVETLRSKLAPIMDELELWLEDYYRESQESKHKTLSPLEKVELIESIAIHLQNEMTTSRINSLLHGYGIDFEEVEVADSKRVYVSSILPTVDDSIIMSIANDLGLSKEESVVEANGLELLSEAYIQEAIQKCHNKLTEGDYDGVITNANALLETLCQVILEKLNIEYKYDGKLKKLYTKVSAELNMRPESYEHDAIIKVLSGFGTVVEGLANLRNSMSDAHGQTSVKKYKPSKRHAILAVNTAKTVSAYLWMSYEAQYSI